MMKKNKMGLKVFQQFMDIFINPEIQKRKQKGEIHDPFDLRASQILFFGDGRKPLIRINSEVKAIAMVKKKDGISKKKGDPIFEHELLGITELKLTEKEDPNCGHATLLRLNDIWYIFFDFRYNKARSLRSLTVAKEFFESAEFACNQRYWVPFADNLFSAAELMVKSTLLSFPDPSFVKKTTHKDIQMKFNKYAKLGNVKPKYHETFNKLSGLRIEARYLKKEVTFSKKEAQKLLDSVREMLENGFNRIK